MQKYRITQYDVARLFIQTHNNTVYITTATIPIKTIFEPVKVLEKLYDMLVEDHAISFNACIKKFFQVL